MGKVRDCEGVMGEVRKGRGSVYDEDEGISNDGEEVNG